MNGIEVRQVTKRYKNVTALDAVTLTFEYGKIYGLLGRNGAGKSTLINIISNRRFATEGTVTIDGLAAEENGDVHEKIFCMSETDFYDGAMKVGDIFKWTGRFYENFDEAEACRIAEIFELDLKKRFKALSTGYRSIAKLCIALAMKVPYVIFDEPVLGLDANHRERFYECLLAAYEKEERTYIIATHLIEEVANLIEDVVVIDKGQVLLQENVENLLAQGYCVSGAREAVDVYCAGKQVIGEENLGPFKLAYVMGARDGQGAENLQFSAMNLQKLFVKLTEKGEEHHA